jgi:hypothetical protein
MVGDNSRRESLDIAHAMRPIPLCLRATAAAAAYSASSADLANFIIINNLGVALLYPQGADPEMLQMVFNM